MHLGARRLEDSTQRSSSLGCRPLVRPVGLQLRKTQCPGQEVLSPDPRGRRVESQKRGAVFWGNRGEDGDTERERSESEGQREEQGDSGIHFGARLILVATCYIARSPAASRQGKESEEEAEENKKCNKSLMYLLVSRRFIWGYQACEVQRATTCIPIHQSCRDSHGRWQVARLTYTLAHWHCIDPRGKLRVPRLGGFSRGGPEKTAHRSGWK